MFSFLLVAELPTYLRKWKLMRWLSLIEAGLSTIFWGWTLAEWLLLMYGGARRDFESAGYLMESIFTSYNVIMHWAIMPINLAILIKEASVEQMYMHEKQRGQVYDIGLGWS